MVCDWISENRQGLAVIECLHQVQITFEMFRSMYLLNYSTSDVEMLFFIHVI